MESNINNSKIQLPPFQPMVLEMQQQQQQQQQQQHHLQQQQPVYHPFNNHTAPGGSSNMMAIPPIVEGNLKKNGKSRLRVKKACDRCKRQKIKCDGQVPCLTCARHKRKCEYSSNSTTSTNGHENFGFVREGGSVKEEVFSSRRPSFTEESGGVDQSYVRYLESKIKELQKYVTYNNFNSEEIQESFEKNMYTFSKDKYRVMRRYQNILPYELGKSLVRSLDTEDARDLIVPRIQFYAWNMSGEHFLSQRELPPLVHLIDLTNDLNFSDWLIDYFLSKINPLFSIVHEKVFRNQYSNYTMNLMNEDTSQSTRLFSALLYLIFAISIRYAENDPSTPTDVKGKIFSRLEEKLFDSAYEVIYRLSFEWQAYELIQGWILITLYLRTTYRQNSSYMSLGNAIRMCKGMSLNLNLVPETLDKPYEWTKARRAFWLVYTWDRLHGFQSGKGYDIQDRTIITPYPSLSEESDDGWLSKPALAMIHLARTSGEIQNFVNGKFKKDLEFIEKISRDLKQWKEWFDKNSEGFDKLLINQVYLTYHDIVLNLNNKVLFKLVEKEYYPDDYYEQMTMLLTHCSEVLQIFKEIESNGKLFVPWWLNLALLFNIALIDIFMINAGLYQSVCLPNLKESLRMLAKLEQKANMAKECVWALKMLNHICVQRMNKSIKDLTDIGIDHGSGNVNEVKFLQFGKVDDIKESNEQASKKRKMDETEDGQEYYEQTGYDRKSHQIHYQTDIGDNLFQNDGDPDVFDLNNVNGLLGNLRWFDQWVDNFDSDPSSVSAVSVD